MIDKYVLKNIQGALIDPGAFIVITIFNFFAYLYLFRTNKVFLFIFFLSLAFVLVYSLQKYGYINLLQSSDNVTWGEMLRISLVLIFFIIGLISLVFLLVIEGLMLGLYLIILFIRFLAFLLTTL